MIHQILGKLKLFLFKKKWKRVNKHNFTNPRNVFPIQRVEVGKYSYGPLNVRTREAENEKLIIGSFVSIAEDVLFILGGNHNIETFSTYPFKVMFRGDKQEAWSKGPIIVEDDVWIGARSLILSGVTIGKGAIVAAGSVITKNVPPYSIVGGNPAKIIRYRFEDNIIKELLEIDYSTINKKFVLDNIDNSYNKKSLKVVIDQLKRR